MQGNFKYPRIKKIITRIDKKVKIFVLYSHELLSTKIYYIQFIYFMYYLFQDKLKFPKIIKIQQVHQMIHTKQCILFYLNCFLFVIHLNI